MYRFKQASWNVIHCVFKREFCLSSGCEAARRLRAAHPGRVLRQPDALCSQVGWVMWFYLIHHRRQPSVDYGSHWHAMGLCFVWNKIEFDPSLDWIGRIRRMCFEPGSSDSTSVLLSVMSWGRLGGSSRPSFTRSRTRNRNLSLINMEGEISSLLQQTYLHTTCTAFPIPLCTKPRSVTIFLAVLLCFCVLKWVFCFRDQVSSPRNLATLPPLPQSRADGGGRALQEGGLPLRGHVQMGQPPQTVSPAGARFHQRPGGGTRGRSAGSAAQAGGPGTVSHVAGRIPTS